MRRLKNLADIEEIKAVLCQVIAFVKSSFLLSPLPPTGGEGQGEGGAVKTFGNEYRPSFPFVPFKAHDIICTQNVYTVKIFLRDQVQLEKQKT